MGNFVFAVEHVAHVCDRIENRVNLRSEACGPAPRRFRFASRRVRPMLSRRIFEFSPV